MVFQTDALRSNKEHIFLKFQPARLMYTFLTSSKDRFQINIRVISFFFAWVHSDYDRNIYILQKTFGQVLLVFTYLCIAKKSSQFYMISILQLQLNVISCACFEH